MPDQHFDFVDLTDWIPLTELPKLLPRTSRGKKWSLKRLHELIHSQRLPARKLFGRWYVPPNWRNFVLKNPRTAPPVQLPPVVQTSPWSKRILDEAGI